jgi:outer membrane protein, heavy metal efflux system
VIAASCAQREVRRMVGCSLLLSAFATAAPSPLLLEEILAEVAEAAPSVRVQQEVLAEAMAATRAAGAWEDPTVSIMAEELPLRGRMQGESAMGPMVMYRLTQPLNLFGRRGFSRQAATRGAEAERERLRRVEWNARAQATAAFYELWMQDQVGRLLEEQVRLLRAMGEAALSRYRAGMAAGHHEYLRAEGERAATEADLAALEDERLATATMLNVLRGRDPAEPVGGLSLPPREPIPSQDALGPIATSRPELRQMEAMSAQMRAREALARRTLLPRVMVQGQYEQRRQVPDTLGAAVMLTVPLWWWDRQWPELQLAGARVRRADREREAMEAMTDADLRMARATALAALRRVEALERSALPRLEETVKSTQAAYMAGSADFLALLDSSLSLRMQQRAHLRALVDLRLAQFELSRLLGQAAPAEERRDDE